MKSKRIIQIINKTKSEFVWKDKQGGYTFSQSYQKKVEEDPN
jgi:hypothetical protein